VKLKKRLDILIAERYPQYSRQQIQSWIMQGLVSIDSQIITKPGAQVSSEARIELAIQEPRYVSRAGFKLEHALESFNINVQDRVVLDAGISTGGFADCLLQHGARKIYGVDVGYGQVHEKIRRDPRVKLLERTNLRTLEPELIGEQVDIITLDLSFISLLKVMPAVTRLLKADGQLIVLIKPQFEAGREEIGRGGIVKDPEVHERVIKNVVAGITSYGFELQGVIESPITGTQGNKEFLAYFKRIPHLE
jgi:23S rRNA (cytidine1920-2'-O)/16S rRNA (cytidine1409-2'-O)-methyltransferase